MNIETLHDEFGDTGIPLYPMKRRRSWHGHVAHFASAAVVGFVLWFVLFSGYVPNFGAAFP
jgi:hypothetical protein